MRHRGALASVWMLAQAAKSPTVSSVPTGADSPVSSLSPWLQPAALSAIVALLALLLTHFVGRKRLRYWRLQRALNKERGFYSTKRAPTGQPSADRSEAITGQYTSSVAAGLLGFEQLPEEALRETRSELRRLLSNLRATHATLVAALEPFSLTDARKFFEEFDSYSSRIATLYHGGQIPHDARTHCDEIEEVVSALAKKIQGSPAGWQKIEALRYSVVADDSDVIVPVMSAVLERAQLELDIIGQAIRERDFAKAVFLKERFWFEVRGFYHELTETLTKMGNAAQRI
jgi:hypothetical protein